MPSRDHSQPVQQHQPRQPRGTPVGGQYDTIAGGGASSDLDDGQDAGTAGLLDADCDAAEVHRQLSAMVARLYHFGSPDDRADAAGSAYANALASPQRHALSRAYLRRLAGAAVSEEIAGDAFNKTEYAARGAYRAAEQQEEQRLGRTLTGIERDALAQKIADTFIAANARRPIGADYRYRSRGPLAAHVDPEDRDQSRKLDEAVDDDPLAAAADRIDAMDLAGLPTSKRLVVGMGAYLARHGAPEPMDNVLPRSARAKTIRAIGGKSIFALARDFHESDAERPEYQALFAPWGETTEAERDQIARALEDAGQHACEFWQACLTNALRRYPRTGSGNPVEPPGRYRRAPSIAETQAGADPSVAAWSKTASRYGAPRAPLAPVIAARDAADTRARVARAGGAASLAARFHESDADRPEYQALFAPWGPTAETDRANIADALTAAGDMADHMWAGCLKAATRR